MAQQQFNIQRLGAVFALVLGLCACGGGGGGSSAAPRPQPSQPVVQPVTPPDTTAYIMDQFFPDKNFAGFAFFGESGESR